ncbi:MAG TPA: metallophosphoesterase [Vicinamibacteria bacterium]|nr:metallophosphoesterase [Vicinamibacteria bacterium]
MNRKLFLAAVPLAMVCLGGWVFWVEPSSLVVRHETIVLPRWHEEQSGLTLALMSDLHVGSPHFGLEALENVVQTLNEEEEPDLVLLAGDYVIHGVLGGSFVAPEQTAAVLSRLRARLGVYAVLGNHDWWLDGDRVRDALACQGIAVLEDEALRITKDPFDFWLVGLNDVWEAPPDPDAVVARIPDDGLPVLAFTHNPDLFPAVPARIDLTLAGHTHGGQVRFPFFGTPVVPSRYGDRYARGHVIEAGRHLFVTSGLGTSILPVRFRVPPEVVLLRLASSDARNVP